MVKAIPKFYRLLILAGILVAGANQAQAAFVPADFVYVIDYSGSMGADINEVINNIGTFNSALASAGIDSRYGAVQFGQIGNGGNPQLLTDLTDAAGLSAALTGALPVTGGFEPGGDATVFALNNITFRAGAVKNIILITDEDDDSGFAGFAAADAALTASNALFNAIIDPFQDTNSPICPSCYANLASNHGGSIFNILDFRADPAAFLTNFNNTKIQEVINAPEPSIVGLVVMGLAGIGFLLRRRRALMPVFAD